MGNAPCGASTYRRTGDSGPEPLGRPRTSAPQDAGTHPDRQAFTVRMQSSSTTPDCQRHWCGAVDAEDPRCARTEIDYASAHIRPAIVDAHCRGAAVAVVMNRDPA